MWVFDVDVVVVVVVVVVGGVDDASCATLSWHMHECVN